MSTGTDMPDTRNPRRPSDLFAIRKLFQDTQTGIGLLDVPDELKQPLLDAARAEFDGIEAAIVAELQAQQAAGRVPPGGVTYGTDNFTVENGKLAVEVVPTSDSLDLLTSPFGPPPANPTTTAGGPTTTNPTTVANPPDGGTTTTGGAPGTAPGTAP